MENIHFYNVINSLDNTNFVLYAWFVF